MKKRGPLRLISILFIIAVALGVAVRLTLSPVATRLANKKLSKNFQVKAEIGKIDFSLLRGSLVLENLRIAQPQGFGEERFLFAPRAQAKIKISSLLIPPLTIEEIIIDNAELRIVKDGQGRVNTKALARESCAPAQTPPPAQKRTGKPKPVLIKKVSINNLLFSYLDRSVGEKPLKLEIVALNLAAADLIIDARRGREEILPGSLLLTGRIVQEPEDAFLGIFIRLGIMGKDIPAQNATLRLSGLELKSLGSAVPPGAAQTIGGDSIDLLVDLALSPDMLDTDIKIKSVGNKVLSLHIGGTPRKPETDTSNILFGLMRRCGGGVGNLAGNIAGAGGKLIETTVNGVANLGKGTLKTVISMGKGALKTAKGVSTLDMKTAAEGLKETTVGTVTEAAKTVTETAKGLGNGVFETGAKTLGQDDALKWRATIRERWEKAWNEARELVRNKPYPRAKKKKTVLPL